MRLHFYKYHGTGNDFIMIDDREGHWLEDPVALVPRLCDRHFGIGSDGLILIRNHQKVDFEMVYFNPDGSQSLCGNGSRCAVAFARDLGIISGESATFLAYDGFHFARIEGELIHLKMADNDNLQALEGNFFVDTGSPHYIQVVEDLAQWPVVEKGRAIRNAPQFSPGGTNVNFISLDPPSNGLTIRTYERGVENETLSCGTGITAAALVAARKGLHSPVHIHARGGELKVAFQKEGPLFTELFLIGPAKFVFDGHIDTDNL
jgi:diaminopimelate epimerase